MTDIPSQDDLRAYMAGKLSLSRFAEIDAWLATLSDAETEQALTGIDEQGPDLSSVLSAAPLQTGFQAVRGSNRAVEGIRLGSGGMAEVLSAHDRVLDRTIALKVLKVRQQGEDLASYHLRETAFRREAALTAALDHPAIPPVYDIGTADGRPAFTMKRLEGHSLSAVVEAGRTSLIELIQALTRVAEAVAFAHAHHIVHRDLSPNNVLIGDFGAVYVVDWGVATRVGAEAGVRAGTPAWMAPEQHRAAAADPRMDVWALGALLHLVIAGYGPHAVPASGPFAWERRSIPRGLSALMRHCLDPDPAQRYHDASAVAGELHRWLDQGLTLAQGAGSLTVAWLRLRRSPRLRTAVLAACSVALIAGGIGLLSHRAARARAEARVAEIANGVPLDRPEAMAVAIDELTTLRAAWPTLASAAALESRLQTARDVAEATERSAQLRERLNRLLVRTRQLGPWTDQVQPWREVLRDTGLTLERTNRVAEARSMRDNDLAALQAESLAFLWRAEREQNASGASDAIARLLAEGGPSAGWQALGRLLPRAAFRAHDPVFTMDQDAETVLADPASAAVALALFAPDQALAAYATQRLLVAPGDFWALIAAGRAALADHDVHEAQHLAFIASGAEPGSLLPRLLLAYVSLENETWQALLRQADRGMQTDPTNTELITLRAVALAHLDRRDEAQRLVDGLPPGHLRYHLTHRVGHPMELAVDALVAANLQIADATPDLGPLAPAQHHH